MLLERLGAEWEWVAVDILAGEARTADFRLKSPHGRVPVLEPRPGVFLPESNAILCYLAEGTPWLPDDRLDRAQVLRWMFFEQNNHETSIAVSRALCNGYYDAALDPEERQERLRQLRGPGLAALKTMESRLRREDWFVGPGETIADLALYAYTHTAGEGGFDLDSFPGVQAWLERVESHPRHIRLADLLRR
ncbi:MAG: glutathione S-transferase family protein [Planctomycetes bacterium]|nr:glutathione S-transferase family protein [Planctomycetota bacterium]MBL7008720.1 glutathione S-transferase family protein [Planctomycetota bacterium]